LGADTVKEMAEKMGVAPDVLAAKLAEILPKAVDHLTPGGTIPT
jgi:uncharacterized protein YidB (DUF937 family)